MLKNLHTLKIYLNFAGENKKHMNAEEEDARGEGVRGLLIAHARQQKDIRRTNYGSDTHYIYLYLHIKRNRKRL